MGSKLIMGVEEVMRKLLYSSKKNGNLCYKVV